MKRQNVGLFLGIITVISVRAVGQTQLNTPVTPTVTPTYTSTPNPNHLNPSTSPDPVIQRTNTDGGPVRNPAPAGMPIPPSATQPNNPKIQDSAAAKPP